MKGKNMSKQLPSHIAYIVEKDEADTDAKGFWREVGAVWPHKSGGFDLVIHPQISVSGRITCRERKDKPATATE
jgi:hypothetical protein